MTSEQLVRPGSSLAGTWELIDPLPVDGASYIEPEILAVTTAGYFGGDSNADAAAPDQLELPDVGISIGQVKLVGHGVLTYTGSYLTSWNVPSPTMYGDSGGVKVGDLFVVDITFQELNDPGAASTPATWSLRNTWAQVGSWIPRVTRFYKFATADGQSGAVTITGPNARAHAYTRVYRGVDPSTPFDTATTTSTGNGNNPNPPALTTATDEALIETLVTGNNASGTWSPPSGFEFNHVFENPRGFAAAWKRRTTAGTEDPAPWAGYADNWRCLTEAFRPATNTGLTLIVLGLVSDSTATAVPGTSPSPGQAEQQRIISSLTSGTFTLTFDGQTTGAIAYDASAGAVQAALEALSNVGAGDVVVTGGPLDQDGVTVTFQNGLGVTDLPLMTASSGLISITEISKGHPAYSFTWEGAINVPRWAIDPGWLAGSAPQINIWSLRPPSYVPGTKIDVTVSDHDGNQTWSLILLVVKDGNPSNPISENFGSYVGALAASGATFGPIIPPTAGSKVVAILGQSTVAAYDSPPTVSAPPRYKQVAQAVSDRSQMTAFLSPPVPAALAEAFGPAGLYYYNFPTTGDQSVLPAIFERYNGNPGNGGFGQRNQSQLAVVAEGTATDGPNVLRITAQDVAGVHMHGGVKIKLPFTYGEFETRVRVSDDASEVTSGLVIFWPESNVWPQGGELDFWETFNHRDTRTPTQSYIHRLNPAATLPYDAADDEVVVAYEHAGVDQSDWHKLQCRWTPDYLSISIDNGPFTILTTDRSHIPDWPMEVTLQLDAWSNTPPASPVTMDIDYVLLRGYTPANSPEFPGATSWTGAQDVVAGSFTIEPAGSAGALDLHEVLSVEAQTTWVELANAAGSMYEVIELDLGTLPPDPWLVSARLEFAHSSNVRSPLRAVLAGIRDDGSIVLSEEQRPEGYTAEPAGIVQTVVGPTVSAFTEGSPISDFERLGIVFISTERNQLLESHKLFWARAVLTIETGRPVVSGLAGPTLAGDPFTWNYSSTTGLPQAQYELRVISGPGMDPEEAATPPAGLLAQEGEIIYDSGPVAGASTRSVVLADSALGRGPCTVALRAWGQLPSGSLIPSQWATATFDISGSPPVLTHALSPWRIDGVSLVDPSGAAYWRAGVNGGLPIPMPDGHLGKFGGSGAQVTAWYGEAYPGPPSYHQTPDEWPNTTDNRSAGVFRHAGGFFAGYTAWSQRALAFVPLPDRAAAINGYLSPAAAAAGVERPVGSWKNFHQRANCFLRSSDSTWITASDANPITASHTIGWYVTEIGKLMALGFTVFADHHDFTGFDAPLPAAFVADPMIDPASLPDSIVKDSILFYDALIAEYDGTDRLVLCMPNEPYTGGLSPELEDFVKTFHARFRGKGWDGVVLAPTGRWCADLRALEAGGYDALIADLDDPKVGFEAHLYGTLYSDSGVAISATYGEMERILLGLEEKGICVIFTEYGQPEPVGLAQFHPDPPTNQILNDRCIEAVRIMATDFYGEALGKRFPWTCLTWWTGTGDHTWVWTFALMRGQANLANPALNPNNDNGVATGTWKMWEAFDSAGANLELLTEGGAAHLSVSQAISLRAGGSSESIAFNKETGTVDIEIVTPAGVSRAWLLRSADGGSSWTQLGPFPVAPSSVAKVSDHSAPMMSAVYYLVSLDSGPMSESSVPVDLGSPVSTETEDWYMIVPSSPGLSTRVEVSSVSERTGIRAVSSDGPEGAMVATSRPLAHRMTLTIRTRNAGERAAVLAVIESGLAIRVVNILGQEWLMRVESDIDLQLQRWRPLKVERTKLRDAYETTVSLIEVRR